MRSCPEGCETAGTDAGRSVEMDPRATVASRMLAYFLTPVQVVRRNMQSLGVSEADMPELIDKLYSDQAASVADLIEKHHKPLIGFTFQSPENPFIEKLLNCGLTVLPSPERAARAMAALVCYSRIVSRPAT